MTRRNVKWTPKIQEKIIELRRLEGISCEKVGNMPRMPSESAMWKRLKSDAEFRRQWEEASLDYADKAFEQLEDMADQATPENVQCVKLKVNTRQWVLSKRSRQKYGEHQKIEAEHHIGEALTSELSKALAEAKKRRDAIDAA